MSYRFSSLQQILDAFAWSEALWVTQIAESIGKSNVIVHKYLKELVEQGRLEKIGTGPMTKYLLTTSIEPKKQEKKVTEDLWENLSYTERKLLDEIFLKFTPEWNILKWYNGFRQWCLERGLNIEEKVVSYISIYKHIEHLQNACWLIEAKQSFGNDFEAVFLDSAYYADQYKWMDFGRWKLAEMTFYAKQSQNKSLITESVDEIIHKIECHIQRGRYSAIAIVPWSIDRKNQLLKILKNRLKSLNLPFVNIIKYYPNGIAIPQKTLKTREQRIQNARNTIFVDDKNIKQYEKVFLIDDFVGSWATLNETARKLKQSWVKQVDGFAFVGNLNLSYEVINEI